MPLKYRAHPNIYIEARSVPKKERPYPPLAEAFKRQRIFEFQDVHCTLVGFCCPSYVAGLNIPDYHSHFLAEDKNAGGHVFECVMEKALVEIDHISAFYLALPETDDFFKMEALQ